MPLPKAYQQMRAEQPAMADAYEINVAPHNFYGPLATTMSSPMARNTIEPAIFTVE